MGSPLPGLWNKPWQDWDASYYGTYMGDDCKINACPWFDRVDTKSNPVDGLSRGDLSGDWDLVTLVFPGPELSAAYRRSRRYAPA